MITFEHEIDIARPIDTVFAFLTNVSRYPEWQQGLAEYRQTSDGPLAVGTTGIAVRNIMGQRDESTWQVTEYVPNTSYVVTIAGSLAGEIANTLQPVGNGTHVRVRFQAESKGLMRIAEPIMAGFVKKEFTDGYGKMKELLESQ